MNKKIGILFIFISLAMAQKSYADLNSACMAIDSQDSQLASTLALSPDRSYYDYFLSLAIEKNNSNHD